MNATAKMLPVPTPETKTFWDKARAHELWLPVCVDSGRAFFPPRMFSPFTGGAVQWRPASGRAKLASYVIVHRAAPGFESEAPYIVALAALEEGPHMVTNLPGAPCDPARLTIGAALAVTFEQRGEVTLPQFRLVSES
jgi:uncharacterized OB-fold protein